MPKKENNILEIQTGAENPILRKKSEEIQKITPEIKGLVLNMIDTCAKADGIGLAAPQVGESLRLFIVRIPISEKKYFTQEFINPKILKISKEKSTKEEGCLSLPNFYTNVERSKKITVEYQDKNGEEQKIKTSGFLARVIQHETDHLNGILIIDKK